MKRVFLASLFTFCLFSLYMSAQAAKAPVAVAVVSLADSAEYTGQYKYEGLPFEYMTITLKDGKLYYSGGEYNGFLDPLKNKKDVFDASGVAVFTFTRNSENKVAGLSIEYQGETYSGVKEEKKG